MRPPNTIALKQTLLQGFQTAPAQGPRAHVRVGLLNVLAQYDQLPFWHVLFGELGFSVVVSHGLCNAGLESIPSESVCFPAKQAHLRLYDLLERGATHVFFPVHDRLSRCAVNCCYASVLETVPPVREGQVQLVAPLLLARKAAKFQQLPYDQEIVLASLRQLVPEAPPTQAEFQQAFQAAWAVQVEFEQLLEHENDRACAWARQPGNRALVLAGRPYHADPFLLKGLDAEVTALGLGVLCGTHLSGPKPPDDGVPPWRPAKHLLKLAGCVAAEPHLDLVCLQAFGCGYDHLNMPEVRAALTAVGKPFTLLQLDDISNNAQARIRLRTLVYVAKQAESVRIAGPNEGASSSTSAPFAAPRLSQMAEGLPPEVLQMARELDPRAFTGLQRADVDAVFGGYPDLCFVAQALAGRAARLCAKSQVEGAPLQRVAVPYVCKYCMLDALPRIVMRTLGWAPEVDWVDYPPAAPAAAPAPAARAPS
ncbi:MAG: acyl-CoA dehydratase activase-related protein [Coriobacteriia bacterium]|nr:acyl-CoA dehydratase activase-related protein [Coriobacteriia bacterium]